MRKYISKFDFWVDELKTNPDMTRDYFEKYNYFHFILCYVPSGSGLVDL